MKMWERFKDWYYGNNDIEKEPPRKGIKRVGYVLWNYSTEMIGINFLFLLTCIPIITIPAAVIALNRYIGKIYGEGYGYSIQDYFREFKNGFLKAIPAGILPGGLAGYSYYLLSLAGNFSETGYKDIITGIGLGVLVIAVLLASYLFVLASIVELPSRHLIKNSFILMLCEWKANLWILVAVFGLGFGTLACMPYSLFFVLLFFFSVLQLIICAIVLPIIYKRVIEPYEK